MVLGTTTAPPRPQWFDPSIATVLDGAAATMPARGPREVEQVTAQLLGAELHRAVRDGHDVLWFDRWFDELVTAAVARAEAGAREPMLRLLHGLTALAPPTLEQVTLAARNRVRRPFGRDLPRWLADLPGAVPTGEVLRMRDAYGTRFAVVAGFRYPGGRDPSVFLFDIDASGFVRLAHAGVYDDVDSAAADWWARLGAAAGTEPPRPVAGGDELLCLVHCDLGEERQVTGEESRAVLDNWFRARRRQHDLAAALRDRGRALPEAESLYHGVHIDPMVKEFTDWFAARHGTPPGAGAVELAAEWMEGTLPETWYSVSPRRLEHLRGLLADWNPNDPVTIEATALLPEWTRWLGERAGLDDDLLTPMLAQLKR